MAASRQKCLALPLDLIVQFGGGFGSQITFSKCVEELVYNSIDANSTVIEINIDSEKFRVKVQDNGHGINEEDLQVIGTRFTTSKCRTVSELNSLSQYGFRGISLFSICLASHKVEITTCNGNNNNILLRRKLKYNDPGPVTHEIRDSKNNDGSTGTEVHVVGVTHNTGIDMSSELEYIKNMLQKICLINPHVSIILRDENSNNIHFKSMATGSITKLFCQLISKFEDGLVPNNLMNDNNLLEINHSESFFKLEGFVSTSMFHESKYLQLLYVNKRFVGAKSKIIKILNHQLSKALGLRPTATATNSQSLFSSQGSRASESSSIKKKHPIFLINITCPFNEYNFIYDEVKFRNLEILTRAVDQFIKNFQFKRGQELDPTNLINISDTASSLVPSKRSAVTSHEEEQQQQPPSKQQNQHSNNFYSQQQQPGSNFSISNNDNNQNNQNHSWSSYFKFPNIWRQQQNNIDRLPISTQNLQSQHVISGPFHQPSFLLPPHKKSETDHVLNQYHPPKAFNKIPLPPPFPPKVAQLPLPFMPFSLSGPSKYIEQGNKSDLLWKKSVFEIPILNPDDTDISRKRQFDGDEPMESGSQDSKRLKIEKTCNISDEISYPSSSKSPIHSNIDEKVEDNDIDDDDASIISNSLKEVAISTRNNSKANRVSTKKQKSNIFKTPNSTITSASANIFSPTRPLATPFSRWSESLPTCSLNVTRQPFVIPISPIYKSSSTPFNHSPSSSMKIPFRTPFKSVTNASCNRGNEGQKNIQHNATTPSSSSFDGNKTVQLFSGEDSESHDNEEVLNLSLEVGQQLVQVHALPEGKYYPLMFTAVLTSPPQATQNNDEVKKCSNQNDDDKMVMNIPNNESVGNENPSSSDNCKEFSFVLQGEENDKTKLIEKTLNDVPFQEQSNVINGNNQNVLANQENPSESKLVVNEETMNSNLQTNTRREAKSEPPSTKNYKSILSFGGRLSKLNQYIAEKSMILENVREETSHNDNSNNDMVGDDGSNDTHNEETEPMSQQSVPPEKDKSV